MEEYLTPKMVGEKLHIGRNRAYSLFKRPDFPLIRIGKTLLVDADSLKRYIELYQSQGEQIEV